MLMVKKKTIIILFVVTLRCYLITNQTNIGKRAYIEKCLIINVIGLLVN